ncbi:hypothetical protein Pmani_029469 [Petrolisthes manimaculis]|uniref:ERCC6L2-like ribbon-helix-helix domain-containing protein n=1 Tax=Petrolisthes manimaculis TaxID=1843537 RepID=A0AAE1NZY6_9EUCA|nr:hypothetical protein Pmani_029469 [Petrolisthes manimaculis]
MSDPVNSRITLSTSRETLLYGQTPKAIRRQQLERMAEEAGMSVSDLAEKIASGNTLQRLHLLKDYHTKLRPNLIPFFNHMLAGLGADGEEGGGVGEGGVGVGEREGVVCFVYGIVSV